MKPNGRPRGTGCDDLFRIVRIRRLMRDTGRSRRSAIIELYGHEQLRRLEKKMAAMDPSDILGRLTDRLVATRTHEARHETLQALGDEGYLVLWPFLRGGVFEHLACNTLSPFASAESPPSPRETRLWDGCRGG